MGGEVSLPTAPGDPHAPQQARGSAPSRGQELGGIGQQEGAGLLCHPEAQGSEVQVQGDHGHASLAGYRPAAFRSRTELSKDEVDHRSPLVARGSRRENNTGTTEVCTPHANTASQNKMEIIFPFFPFQNKFLKLISFFDKHIYHCTFHGTAGDMAGEFVFLLFL